jgi:hypothetical protein
MRLRERNQNMELKIGSNYTTTKSGVTGIIKRVDTYATVCRILLDIDGQDRWTTLPIKKSTIKTQKRKAVK